jgi:hypothetical protein
MDTLQPKINKDCYTNSFMGIVLLFEVYFLNFTSCFGQTSYCDIVKTYELKLNILSFRMKYFDHVL